jgi:tetrahydromethanopterin S-methyltransferase subunit F
MPSPRLVQLAPGPLPERSDDELLTLSQAGLRHAFAVLVERHAERPVHSCSRFVNDIELGADLIGRRYERPSAQARGDEPLELAFIQTRDGRLEAGDARLG